MARHGEASLAEYMTPEKLGFANVRAIVAERCSLGAAVPTLPEHLVQPLARYLDDLSFYAPDLRLGDEGFARAAEQSFFVIETLLRCHDATLP